MEVCLHRVRVLGLPRGDGVSRVLAGQEPQSRVSGQKVSGGSGGEGRGQESEKVELVGGVGGGLARWRLGFAAICFFVQFLGLSSAHDYTSVNIVEVNNTK